MLDIHCHQGVVNRQGQGRTSSVPNRDKSSRQANAHPTSRDLESSLSKTFRTKSARTQSLACAKMLSDCNHGYKLEYWRIQKNRVGGPQYPRRGNLILDTLCPRLWREQTRVSQERSGVVPSPISSPGYQTRPHAIVSARAAKTDVYDVSGTTENDSSSIVVIPNAVTAPYLRIAVTGQTE